MSRFSARIITACLLGFATFSARAEKPVLEHLYPSGGAIGSTNEVRFFGKFEPWPPKFWSDSDQLSFHAETNKGKATITVATNASPGAHLIRIYNDEGASDPKIFVIGAGNEITLADGKKKEPKGEAINNFPITINGRLEKRGDVDLFTFKMHGGEYLDAKVESYVLMSSLDAVLRLLDASGHELAMNHDWATLDPRLVWRSPVEQQVTLQLFGFAYPANSDIQLSGGEGAVYRLHLALEKDLPADLRETLTEVAANDSRTNAQPLEISKMIVGSIGKTGDEDCYAFAGKKDDWYEFTVAAASLGSSLDAWMKIEDEAGKELARDDDGGNSRDPRIEWKAPGDGKFFVRVGSVTHRGGREFRYHLQSRKLLPDFEARMNANTFEFTPGSTNDLKFTVKRLRGFTNELTASLESLPEGINCEPNSITKEGDSELKAIVATNAPPHNGPIRILIEDRASKAKRAIPFEFISRTENNGVPGGYTELRVNKTDQLWLTVKPKPAEEKKK